MEFSFRTFVQTMVGCLSDFHFYRILVRRPWKDALLHLAVILVIPSLVFGAIQVYIINRITSSITEALKGNLPALRVDKGRVQMEGETFRFEKENEFAVSEWKSRLAQVREADRDALVPARRWIDENFPDPKTKLKRSEAEAALGRLPPEPEKAAKLLKETADFGSFVFIVDLTGKEPEFPPGGWGFALSQDSYFFNFQRWPYKRPLPQDASLVVNDQTLERWRKLVVWQQAPMIILMMYAFSFLGAAVFILLGALISAITAAMLKSPLPIRQVILIGIYALTPAILFASVATLFPFSGAYLWWAYLIIYGVYVAGATKNCSFLS